MGKVSISLHHVTAGTDVAPAAPTLGQNPTVTTTSVTFTIVPAALPAGAAPVSAFYVYQGGVKVRTLGATELVPTITGLTAGTLYQFSVSAYNGQEGPRSADLAVVTQAATAPSAPTGLTVTPSSTAGTGVASWTAATAPDTDPVQGYRVRRVGSTVVLADVTTTSATITGLTDGDQLVVKAYNSVGQGAASNTATFNVTSSSGTTLSSPLPAGRVGGTYSIAMPKMVGTYADHAVNKAALLDLGVKQWRSSFQPDLSNYRTRTSDLALSGLRSIARLGQADTASTIAAGQDTPAQLVAKMVQYWGTDAANPTRKVEDTFCMVEGINEPNNDGVAFINDTVKYTKDTWDAIQANSQVKAANLDITGPAFARLVGTGAEGPTLLDQATRMAAAADAIHSQTGQGLKPWTNIGVTHIYPKGSTPSTDYDYFKSNVSDQLYPGMRNSTTEGGYSTDMLGTLGAPVPEAVDGIYADRHLCEHILRNSKYFNRHELWDDALPANPTPKERRESSFGLLRANGTQKPAYGTIKNFLALFTDEDATTKRPKSVRATTPLTVTISPGYGAAGSTTNTLRALLFHHSDGTYRVVLWRDVNVKFTPAAPSSGPFTITPLTAVNVTVTLPTVMTVTEYMPSKQAAATVAAARKATHTVALQDYLTVLKLAA